MLDGLASGEVDLLVGTHALIQEAVAFRSLGVVVIDEQHRFGVEQRAALRDKAGGGAVPDVLVMTATPIPRTAAMTVYGDLDVSVLGEKPTGRQPIVTTWAQGDGEEAEVWAKVREEVAAGRQAYVVCPLIGESDKLEVASAEETFARLEAAELSGLRLGLLHGRLPSAEKEAVMGRFRAGELQVLIATTVIEVGVDVPNATVMVVLDADRFGIAQLHQLRGRVGRGADASYCYLVTGAGGAGGDDDERAAGNARLEAMVRTDDGFELAEVDLEIRGEGTVFGERQKGRSDLKLASLRRDKEAVQHARAVAERLADEDPSPRPAPRPRRRAPPLPRRGGRGLPLQELTDRCCPCAAVLTRTVPARAHRSPEPRTRRTSEARDPGPVLCQQDDRGAWLGAQSRCTRPCSAVAGLDRRPGLMSTASTRSA